MTDFWGLILAGAAFIVALAVGRRAHSLIKTGQSSERRPSIRLSWQEIAFAIGFIVFFAVALGASYSLLTRLFR